ncbi:hypothetical protein, partial [Pedobacter lusitanus]|uniref:hypothetical protein n=1 Tax=Pedobacter lusitanus TaxID=1503925 RepID=UPI001F33FBDE
TLYQPRTATSLKVPFDQLTVHKKSALLCEVNPKSFCPTFGVHFTVARRFFILLENPAME